jgi:hypothetical protein
MQKRRYGDILWVCRESGAYFSVPESLVIMLRRYAVSGAAMFPLATLELWMHVDDGPLMAGNPNARSGAAS